MGRLVFTLLLLANGLAVGGPNVATPVLLSPISDLLKDATPKANS
jgi:hypothetical protein